MINFQEELKRFKPCLEVEEAEGTNNIDEVKDMIDVLNEMMKNIKDHKGAE